MPYREVIKSNNFQKYLSQISVCETGLVHQTNKEKMSVNCVEELQNVLLNVKARSKWCGW